MEYVHRRVLSINLGLVEKCLYDIKGILEANTVDRHFILYTLNNNVDSELRIKLYKVSGLMLDQIEKMKEEFRLESEGEEDSVKKCVAELARSMVFVERHEGGKGAWL